tara:strand:+ start:299 stop:694 length:396 start_codon:yes stop_codon:yes gene_type:complete
MKITKKRLKQIILEELSEARSAAERGEEWDESRPMEEHPGTRRSVAVMKLEEMGEARDSALMQLLRHVQFSDEDLAVLEGLIDLLVDERSRDFREPLEDEKLAALEDEAELLRKAQSGERGEFPALKERRR